MFGLAFTSAYVSAYALGAAGGVRHALEPDHVAAVTTMVAGEKRLSRVVGFATSWGLGHGLMLVGVGGALFATHAAVSGPAGDALELVVSAALVALGIRALVIAKRAGATGPASVHRHGGEAHEHHGPPAHVHVGRFAFARLPFVVGLVHGLSGSGALTAIAISKSPSLAHGLAFMALYAIGAVLGMALLAGVAGVPLARLARKPALLRGVVALSGVVSLGVGVAWACPIVARVLSP